jgi:chloramphenicol 3-O-phosphotransferase
VRDTQVVLLNGPAGVGKTTVGRALAALAPNGACIHGDCLKNFTVTRVEGAVEGGLGYKNGAVVAATFVAAGYDLVVFEYVFEQPSALDRFRAAFHAPAPVSLFTLWAPLEVVVARERGRPDRAPLGRRAVESYRAVERHLDQLGRRIDNVDASPHQVAATIYALCRDGVGRI